jgi:hypothetical protein
MSTTATQSSANAASGQGDSFTGIPVTITNTLSTPIDIYDVFNPAASGQTAPYLYTKLGTIAAGATDTVTTIRQVAQLEAMYTGSIAELQGWYYHQFPIKLMSGTQFSFGNPPPLSYTVAESDRQSMIESLLFHKFAMANPDSALTKNLNAALKQTDSKAVNAFFAGTQNFKDCTLSSWNAVMTWLTMFTSGWQGPYYLYEAAPANPPQNYVPALVGTLNIASSASADSATLALCNQDSSGNLQPLSPAQSSTVGMAGDATMVDQNPGQDVTVSLTPVWMNTIQTTMTGGQPTTSYISGPVLTGTVAGNKVVSTQTLMPLPSQSQSGSQSSSSAASSQTFGTICQVVGLIVGLVMLYEIAEKRLGSKQTAEEKAKADAKSETDYDTKLKTVDAAPENGTADVFSKNAETIAKDATGVSEGYTTTSTLQQKQVLNDTVDSQEQSLGDEINNQLENGYTPTEEFETAVGQAESAFGTARTQINDGNLSGATKTISEAGTSMQTTLDQSAAQLQTSEVEALKNSSEAIDTATSQTDALTKAQEQYDENMKSGEDDSGAPKDDVSPETDPIEGEL